MSASTTRWERAAEQYATGEHRSGRELELALEFATPQGSERLLDIGAGAGHTALVFAPHVRSVVVTDPVNGMLAAARRVFEHAGARNAEFVKASAERLPLPDASFEIVTSRLAAHHFDDVPLAMAEIARVLAREGILVFIDTTAPTDAAAAAWQDDVERLRDPTHVRLYTASQWIAFIEKAGLQVEHVDAVRKAHAFEPWLQRGGEDEGTMQLVRERFLNAPGSARQALEIVTSANRIESFTDTKLVVAARR
ncbi:MAG TPA: class I SAM-dependent methyltransferase [Candidatus Acidoferrum sp.]|nr:class I SAM-dependent methyltransferase [Candidatus Acidoferrum sp.]